MTQFESQFVDDSRYDRRMPNEDFERLAFLNVRVDDIGGEDEVLTSMIDIAQEQASDVNHQIAALRKQIDELIAIRNPIQNQLDQLAKMRRHNRIKKDEYERERARLLQELAARDKFLRDRDDLLNRAQTFPWMTGVDGKKALPHQIEGAHRLVSADRAFLCDDPGLGKTLQAIITVDLLRLQNKGKKVLIFTPKQVLPDFERSFKRWTNPQFVHVLDESVKGIKVSLLEMIKHFPEAIVLTNYEVWRKDLSIFEALKDAGFDTIICDESHVMKGAKSLTTQRMRELVYADNRCPKCGAQNITQKTRWGIPTPMCGTCEFEQEEFGDFCSVKNFYCLTGTPILNKPQDIWPPLNMIDRVGFPDEKSFLRDYCVKEYDYTQGKYVYTFGTGGSERLLKKLGMKYTARTRESAGVIMPPQDIRHHWLEMDPEKYPRQHAFIKQLRDQARLAFAPGAEITTDAVLAWYTRMRQAASWPDAIKIKGCPHNPPCEDEWGLPNPKACHDIRVIFPPEGTPPIGESIIMDEAERIVDEAIESKQRIVVFSMFKGVIAELERRCKAANLRVAKITGDVPQEERRAAIDDFNLQYTPLGEHKFDVLICQYQTAQVGLNLTGAHQILCIDREWNPGKENQTLDRVRRLDSKHETIAHILHCAGTATELIDAIIDQKAAMLEGWQADVDLAEAMRKFLEG
jgi:SNF2 family DNA or RNA helicase